MSYVTKNKWKDELLLNWDTQSVLFQNIKLVFLRPLDTKGYILISQEFIRHENKEIWVLEMEGMKNEERRSFKRVIGKV